MKCPDCKKDMYVGWLAPNDNAHIPAYMCPSCDYRGSTPAGREKERLYHCAFCSKPYKHIQTDDHTPLAELICPKCAKKMGIEVQTHPDDPEDDNIVAFGC